MAPTVPWDMVSKAKCQPPLQDEPCRRGPVSGSTSGPGIPGGKLSASSLALREAGLPWVSTVVPPESPKQEDGDASSCRATSS